MTPTERYELFIQLRKKGETLKQIASRFAITHQAVSDRLCKGPPKPQNKLPDPFWADKPTWMMKGRERVRERVRARDNYQCQDCKAKWNVGTRRLDVHHLNGICGKRSRGYDAKPDMPFLITLCHRCHFNRPDHSQRRQQKIATR